MVEWSGGKRRGETTWIMLGRAIPGHRLRLLAHIYFKCENGRGTFLSLLREL